MVTATLICGVGDVAVLKADAAVEKRADIVTEAVVSQLFRFFILRISPANLGRNYK